MDIPGNIVALDRECHNASHAGREPRMTQLLELAAKREGVSAEWIVDEVYRIRALPKGSEP